jgi:hypothetical protein
MISCGTGMPFDIRIGPRADRFLQSADNYVFDRISEKNTSAIAQSTTPGELRKSSEKKAFTVSGWGIFGSYIPSNLVKMCS